MKHFPKGCTYISERGSSTVDLFLCNPCLIDFVDEMKIESRVESDHLPISLKICNKNKTTEVTTKKIKCKITKYVWDEEKAEEFKNAFLTEESKTLIEDACLSLENDVNVSVQLVNELIMKAGDCMKKTIITGGDGRGSNTWFDDECKMMKKDARHALTKVRMVDKSKHIGKYNEAVKVYRAKRAIYQTCIKKKKQAFKDELFENLMNSQNDSSKFWDIIKKLRKNKDSLPQLDMKKWHDHFKKVLNPNNQNYGT